MNKLELCNKLAGINLPECSVSFKSDDKALENLMIKAETLAAANIVQFSPTMQALIEGGGYSSVYPKLSRWAVRCMPNAIRAWR